MIMMGESDGFTFLNVGRCGRFGGSSPLASAMAAWMSRAAASTSRFKSNCNVIDDEPSVLDDVISVTPAMRPKRRSSGVATADAIVSGLAPGIDAETWMVGKSTRGSGDTGKCTYASVPPRKSAIARRIVATGRVTNGSEMLPDSFFFGAVTPHPLRYPRA